MTLHHYWMECAAEVAVFPVAVRPRCQTEPGPTDRGATTLSKFGVQFLGL